MSNLTKRDEAYKISLADFIRGEYGFKADSLTPASRGFYGETWRLDSGEKSYFVKLVYFAEYQHKYERSFNVMDYLWGKGIDFISRAVKTLNNSLFTHFDGAVLGVFHWLEGENIENNETKIPEYQMLGKIYSLPTGEIDIPREDFSGESADTFARQWKATKDSDILALLEKNREKLEYRLGRLQHFSELCRGDTRGFYITHGDAGGNFFVGKDKNYLIDWDDVLLAPIERDAWVMGFREWARCLFQKILRQNGIEYTLRPERLAYYCYYMFFFWLTWLVKCSDAEDIENYFKGYDEERIEYADELWKQANPPIKKEFHAQLATLENLESWMELVSLLRSNFPGLETQQELDGYRKTVEKNINRKSAVCVLDGGIVVGFLLFSTKENMLCHMGVHPRYRRGKIASKMIEIMLENLDRSRDITVITFREGDDKGTAARALYKSFGFEEGELCFDMNYPEQKFILRAR